MLVLYSVHIIRCECTYTFVSTVIRQFIPRDRVETVTYAERAHKNVVVSAALNTYLVDLMFQQQIDLKDDVTVSRSCRNK